jgi:hypothetical protein
MSPIVILRGDDGEILNQVVVQLDRSDIERAAQIAIDRQYGGVPMSPDFVVAIATCSICAALLERNANLSFHASYWLSNLMNNQVPWDYGLQPAWSDHLDEVLDEFWDQLGLAEGEEMADDPASEERYEQLWEEVWQQWHAETTA